MNREISPLTAGRSKAAARFGRWIAICGALLALGGMALADELGDLKQRAERGDVKAMNFLGRIYALGEGVPQNTPTALKWLRLAADKGDPGAMMKIGDIYFSGRGGIPVDQTEAVKWIRMAADRGNGDAMAYLSTLYHDGLGIARDDLKAYEWASKAVDAGNTKATPLRDFLKRGLLFAVDKPGTTTCASVRAKFDADGTITQEKFKQLMISMGYKWNPIAEQNFAGECKVAALKASVTKHQQLWPTNIIFTAKVIDDKGVCKLTDILLEPCE
ncbi:TPR repeat protein [Rhizomicrobium palustre]|uniref:TPR repeat protein n=1 Tax=Rhizomicrobium palustre TaxID=189966 RepID=A0A846N2F0_9PROT|nr:tetratricopeptide repeat protein [Rhizomicrobium palustre]NIK89481.1 TPR repeat protein [Rhizomicrobium palustre]